MYPDAEEYDTVRFTRDGLPKPRVREVHCNCWVELRHVCGQSLGCIGSLNKCSLDSPGPVILC